MLRNWLVIRILILNNLFRPSFLRDDERIVEKYVDRVLVLVILTTKIDLDDLAEAESSGPDYLSSLLAILWEYPSDQGFIRIGVDTNHYKEFYMALVNDHIDVSMLLSPKE